MFINLIFPVRFSVNNDDELHLKDPSTVPGWNVKHLAETKVILMTYGAK